MYAPPAHGLCHLALHHHYVLPPTDKVDRLPRSVLMESPTIALDSPTFWITFENLMR